MLKDLIAVFSPLLGALINLMIGRRIKKSHISYISCFFVALGVCCQASLIYDSLDSQGKFLAHTTHLFSFFSHFGSSIAIRFDAISSAMLCLVSIVSLAVHMYSSKYMSDAKEHLRFMIYLSLFTFCMNLLVVSNDMVQLFMAWESVGVLSYLLIGFWFEKDEAILSSTKAFIVNRLGDACLLFGIIMIFYNLGTTAIFDFTSAFTQSSSDITIFGSKINSMNLGLILCTIGCFGKSAQMGLHIWLPDAMTGPTPASALIHAATMVTAGVFLTLRLGPLYSYGLCNFVMLAGAVTALFTALAATCESKIKRVLAYSTCSQIGYMFFACGNGMYKASLFHLINHGFFKSLLFLVAGKIIYYCKGQQDMGVSSLPARYVPITYLLFFIGIASLTGIPPFSGYHSKHLILDLSLYPGHLEGQWDISRISYLLIIITGGLTSFYSFRMLLSIFHQKRDDLKEIKKSAIESLEKPNTFLSKIGLVILSSLSIFSGLLLKPYFSMENVAKHLNMAKEDVFLSPHTADLLIYSGVLLAFIFHFFPNSVFAVINKVNPAILMDHAYKAAMRKIEKISDFSSNFLEKIIFPGLAEAATCLVMSIAKSHKSLYNGSLSRYSAIIILAMLSVIYIYFFSI